MGRVQHNGLEVYPHDVVLGSFLTIGRATYSLKWIKVYYTWCSGRDTCVIALKLRVEAMDCRWCTCNSITRKVFMLQNNA